MAWSRARAWVGVCLLVCLSLMLSACGGGGGGGKPATTAAVDPNAGGPSTDGAFTLSRTIVTAGVVQSTASTSSETIDISSNDDRVAGFAIGYAPGVTPPSWLIPSVNPGQTLNRQLQLSFYPGALAPGVYRTSLRVVAGDIKANILGYKDIVISLTVVGPTNAGAGTPAVAGQVKLTATPSALALQTLEGSSALTESTIEIVADSKAAVTAIVSNETVEVGGVPWLLASSAVRTANGWLLKVRTSSSAPLGQHTATVRLTTLDIDGNVNGSIGVPVTLNARGRLYVMAVPDGALSGMAGEARRAETALYVYGIGLNWNFSLTGGPAGAVVSAPSTGSNNGAVIISMDLSKSTPSSGNLSAVVTADDGQTASMELPYRVYAPTLKLDRQDVSLTVVNGVDIAPLGVAMTVDNGTDPVATVDSDVAWLKVVRTGNTLASGFTLKADASVGPLPSGTHLANVTVSTTTGGVKLTKNLPVKLVLTPATLSTTLNTLQFGGSTGRDLSKRSFGLAISNGLTFPTWTVVSAPSWMSLSRTSGNFTTTSGVEANFAAATLPTGLTKGEVVITAKVNGDTLKATLPVTVRLDAHKLLPSEVGVAFSKVQDWSRLTRQIQVRDNMGLPTPWSASSDQPWLKVTGSGKAGDAITLSADPSGLPMDQLQVAHVTITSSDKTVVDVEPIRVGLWVGSSKLSSITALPFTKVEYFVVDPIRPYFYGTTSTGSDVVTFNIYTGLEVGRLKNVVNRATGGVVSLDGSRLYLKDGSDTVVIDLLNNTKLATWPVNLDASRSLYARPNGKHMLLGASESVDALTGAVLGGSPLGISTHCAMGADLTATYCHNEGISSASLYMGSIDFSLALSPSPFQMASKGSVSQSDMGSNGKDLAISPDGTRMATASGAPYLFPVYDTTSLTAVQQLAGNPYPNNVEYGSDGRLFAGAFNWYDSADLWVYRADGTLHSSYLIRGYAREMLDRAMKVSGDAMFVVVTTSENLLKIVPVGP